VIDQQIPSVDDLNKRRFDELVPAYINSTLEAQDLLFFNDYIAQHPEALSSIAFTSNIANAIKAIGGDRNQEHAAKFFTSAFVKKFHQSLWKKTSNAFNNFIYKPWIVAFLMLFVVENSFLYFENRSHHLVHLSKEGGGIIVTQADASFILNNKVALEDFFDVAQKYNAVIIYSEETPKGPEVQIDIEDESRVLALADELAHKALIKPAETKIAVTQFGRQTWVYRQKVLPQMLAINQPVGKR
jgi:hypothetical protein